MSAILHYVYGSAVQPLLVLIVTQYIIIHHTLVHADTWSPQAHTSQKIWRCAPVLPPKLLAKPRPF